MWTTDSAISVLIKLAGKALSTPYREHLLYTYISWGLEPRLDDFLVVAASQVAADVGILKPIVRHVIAAQLAINSRWPFQGDWGQTIGALFVLSAFHRYILLTVEPSAYEWTEEVQVIEKEITSLADFRQLQELLRDVMANLCQPIRVSGLRVDN